MAKDPPMKLHEALRAATEGRIQKDVAAAMGVDQPQVSKWVTGAQPLRDVDTIAAFEDACERPRGFVLRLAGYVEEPVDVKDAVLHDPALDQAGRTWVLITYDSAVDVARKKRKK